MCGTGRKGLRKDQPVSIQKLIARGGDEIRDPLNGRLLLLSWKIGRVLGVSVCTSESKTSNVVVDRGT